MSYKKVFFDTDLIIDFVSQRQPFFSLANQIFSLMDRSQIKAYTSSVIIANIYYLLEYRLKIKNSRSIVKTLVNRIKILETTEDHIRKSLDYELLADFEDALQIFCALEADIDCIVTRNVKDFKNDLGLRIFSPEEFLAIIES